MRSRLEYLEEQIRSREKKKGLLYHIRKEPILYLMVVPPLVYLLVFKYLPMYGITVAFQKFNIGKGYFGSEWVGLRYFRMFFADPYWFRIVRNTLLLSFYSLVFGFPAPIILAVLLNEIGNISFKRSIQTITYLPHFVSVVVIVGLLKIFFATDGMVNELLVNFGFKAQNFFIMSRWFRPLYISSGIWSGVGWGAIIYLAALTGINEELYEAAYVDGANRWRRILHVTLPGILPTMVLLLIFSLGNIMDVGFEKVFLMYSETTWDVADVIATYVYRRGLVQMQISYAAAVGIFNSVVNFLFLIIANALARRYSGYSLW